MFQVLPRASLDSETKDSFQSTYSHNIEQIHRCYVLSDFVFFLFWLKVQLYIYKRNEYELNPQNEDSEPPQLHVLFSLKLIIYMCNLSTCYILSTLVKKCSYRIQVPPFEVHPTLEWAADVFYWVFARFFMHYICSVICLAGNCF